MKGNLPEDIVLNIFANLPVKSVIRFRCASKAWDSSITTPHFISTHLSLNLNNNNNLDHYHAHLIHLPTRTTSSPSNGPVCCMVARDSSTFNSISEYPIPSALHLSSLRMVGSCNGLVCLAEYGYGSPIADAIYLWNPSIRKYKRLPDFSLTQYHWVSTGFAYQSETNDYKVVKMTQMGAQNHRGVEVYTLSSNSWRRVEMSLGNNVAFNSGNCWPATFVNGALHWLGEVKGGVQLANRDVILSFDVNNDKFGEIALPDGQQQLLPQGLVAVPNDLMVFKGKLAFITFGYITTNRINVEEYFDFMKSHTHKSCFIWVMGEYGVHESWSKLFFVRFENASYVHFYGCNSCGELLVRKEVVVKSNDDWKWLVIVSLDPETLHEKDLGIRNISLLATTFMESLVLLDGAAELSG